MNRFHRRLTESAAAVQGRLDLALSRLADVPVVDAMRWACNGGKGLRGFLVTEGAALYGVPMDRAVTAAAAIEALHAYSLVHDDLPCMDDDALRRGRPTVHVKWDQAVAVLAGDALQSLAFDLLADPACHPDAAVRVSLIGSLARAAGAQGMVLGQALDIAAESAATPLTLTQIEALQAGKTGALIRWSGEAGALLAEADPAPMARYATALGLAFQIADDLLDATGDAAAMGKAAGKDAGAGKATFVSLLGVDGARARARALVDEACEALASFEERAEALRGCAAFVVERDR